MSELPAVLQKEFIYIWYYFWIQLRQICWYWILGMLIGSFLSVFAKDRIHGAFTGIRDKKWGLFGIIPACILGIASPLCMYGTIPIAASFRQQLTFQPRLEASWVDAAFELDQHGGPSTRW